MHGGGASHSLLPSSTADGSSGGTISADTERSCSELCAYIRKRFGIGIDTDESLDAGTRSAFQEVRGGFQRSINRLAEELYAGSAHFVLELIQKRVVQGGLLLKTRKPNPNPTPPSGDTHGASGTRAYFEVRSV